MTDEVDKREIPDFQSIMLPLLQVAADGATRSSAELRAAIADHFSLTAAQLAELLPSGKQPVFNNRVAWASFYLRRAGLLERPSRGHYRISAEGKKVLQDPPPRINIAFLEQFAPFKAFKDKLPKGGTRVNPPGPDDETPEEKLESAHQRIQSDLIGELLEQIRNCTPQFFEKVVVELLVKMGYGGSRRDAGEAIGHAGDEGIDGIIKEDRLGLDVIYLQAKRWANAVGRPEIQKFVGALHGKHARKGVFITAGTFSKEACDYAKAIDPKVILIDGEMMASLMIDCGLGVSTKQTYEVKELDTDYFNED
jgi:restriction system protein